MKLLPPKPPKPLGTEKTVKKKGKEDNALGSTSSEKLPEKKPENKFNAEGVSDSFTRIDELDSHSLHPDDAILENLPPAESDGQTNSAEPLPPDALGDQNLDKELTELKDANSGDIPKIVPKIVPETVPEKAPEKKKSFLSKLFTKKESGAKKEEAKLEVKVETNEESKDEVQDEIKKFEDADNNLDELSTSLEKSIGESEAMEKISSVDETAVPEPIQTEQPVESKYVPGKSWSDDVEELPDIDSSIYSDGKKGKKPASNYIKEDYKKYAPKDESNKNIKGKEKADANKKEDLATSGVESIVDEVIDESKKTKKGKVLKKEKQPKEVKVQEEVEEVTPEVTPYEEKKAKIESNAIDFSRPIDDWRLKSVSMSKTNKKPDSKAIVQIDARLKKLMKVYESKLLKLADDKKKTIAIELNKLNKKGDEVERNEKKFLSLKKLVTDRKREVDTIVYQQKEFAAKKDALQNEVEKYKDALSALKTEFANNRKMYESQKKSISVETKTMQDNLRGYTLTFENEKRKGDRKLAELAKKVEESQAHVDEMMKRSRIVAAQLKAKEAALHEREEQVLELIAQEKKVLAILKGNEEQGINTESLRLRRKSREKKPATIIGFSGEPEIYFDDEDNLNQKISDCKDLIKETNYDDAKLLYNEIREEFMSAAMDEDAKKTIRHEIRELYDEIALKLMSPK